MWLSVALRGRATLRMSLAAMLGDLSVGAHRRNRRAASRSTSTVGAPGVLTSGLGQPQVVDRPADVRPAGGAGSQHHVEVLGPDAAVGVQQYRHAGDEGEHDHLTDRGGQAELRAVGQCIPPWVANVMRVNGNVTATMISKTISPANTRMPNTRQKLLRTKKIDRRIAWTTGRRSSTITVGAKSSTK